MWRIFGSKSEYEDTDADVAERHRLVWQARMLAQGEKQEEDNAKINADAEEAAHDAEWGGGTGW